MIFGHAVMHDFFFFDIFINSKVIEIYSKKKGQFITISRACMRLIFFLSFEELNATDTCNFERAYKITCD